MSLDVLVYNSEHTHVWTRSIDGAEFANSIYENEIDAALDFIGVVKNLTKYNIENEDLTIQDVMESLTEGRGMYAGTPGLIIVLSKCRGGCKSSTWN